MLFPQRVSHNNIKHNYTIHIYNHIFKKKYEHEKKTSINTILWADNFFFLQLKIENLLMFIITITFICIYINVVYLYILNIYLYCIKMLIR